MDKIKSKKRILGINQPRYKHQSVSRRDRCSAITPRLYYPPYPVIEVLGILDEASFKFIDANLHDYDYKYLRKEIEMYRPEVIIFTISNDVRDFDMKLSSITKSVDRSIMTILVYDPLYASAFPEEFLKEYQDLDVIILCGPYPTFKKLVMRHFSELDAIENIAYRDYNGEIKVNELLTGYDYDEVNTPFYNKGDIAMYGTAKGKYILYRSTRDCPYPCNFCLIGGSTAKERGYTRKLKYKSASHVYEDLKHFVDYYGVGKIKFLDETFTMIRSRTNELLDLIIGNNLQIEWYCETRCDCVDMDLLKKMKLAGCRNISFGIEGASNERLKYLQKNLKIEQVIETFKYCNEINMPCGAFFLFGFPDQSLREIDDMLKLALQLNARNVQFSLITPQPKTILFDKIMSFSNFNIKLKDMLNAPLGKKAFFGSPDLSKEQLLKLHKILWGVFSFVYSLKHFKVIHPKWVLSYIQYLWLKNIKCR